MTNKPFMSELIGAGLLIVLVIFLLNPMNWLMPDMAALSITVALVIVFAVYASFVWREKAADERELQHTMFAGRIAFLVGSATLVLGIILESLEHEIDIWLVITLSVMVLAKAAALVYTQNKH